MISLLMPTYNRAGTIGRAIESVLAQTRDDWELVIVDGNSRDETERVVAAYGDRRIRFVKQAENRGVTSGRNRALDEARGEWLGMFDSDDELVPQALAVLMRALVDVDPELDAISCNCFDSVTGRFTGKGLHRDQWLTVSRSLDHARGEHWGIFRARIVRGRRFDERIKGYESLVWNRIHDGARWYYLHRGLRIYHTEGSDRQSLSSRADYERWSAIFDLDAAYLDLLRGWSNKAYRRLCWNAAGQFLLAGDDAHFRDAVGRLRESGARVRPTILGAARVFGPVVRRVAGA